MPQQNRDFLPLVQIVSCHLPWALVVLHLRKGKLTRGFQTNRIGRPWNPMDAKESMKNQSSENTKKASQRGQPQKMSQDVKLGSNLSAHLSLWKLIELQTTSLCCWHLRQLALPFCNLNTSPTWTWWAMEGSNHFMGSGWSLRGNFPMSELGSKKNN